jgi:hypothetical protein
MSPTEAAQWFDLAAKVVAAWGPIGFGLAVMVGAFVIRSRGPVQASPLERDVAAIRAAQTANVEKFKAEIKEAAEKAEAATKAVADELHDIRDRVSRIEGKLEK